MKNGRRAQNNQTKHEKEDASTRENEKEKKGGIEIKQPYEQGKNIFSRC